jgi:hypothetical protein
MKVGADHPPLAFGADYERRTMVTIAYDPVLKRPGCAIVQRSLGATIGNDDLHRMNGWLLSPTPNMAVFPLADQGQIEVLIAITNKENPGE